MMPVEWNYANGPDKRLLGECERGELWVPSKSREGWWDRRLNLRNPTHWRYWLRSRLTRAVVMIESK